MTDEAYEINVLRDTLRKYLASEIEPLIGPSEQLRQFPFDKLRELADFGCIAGSLPIESGGLSVSTRLWASIMEETGYCWLSLRVLLNGIHVAASLLDKHGNEHQKAQFLGPLMRSERRVFIAISEPDVGSNVSAITTRADKRGDRYVLSGTKLWITNGMFGDFGIVVARTFSDSCEGGLSLFLVDAKETELTRRAVDTMVLRSTGTAELTFVDAEIPAANLLGKEGEGLRAVLTGLNMGRLNVAMGAVGAAQRALDLSIEYAKVRTQFGRPIASFQLIQKHIVDMAVKTNAARALGYAAADAIAEGRDSRVECSIAKLFATERAHEVASLAMQVHGGMGYATDYPIERIFRDTRGGSIPEGTTEIQTLIIGRELLGISALT